MAQRLINDVKNRPQVIDLLTKNRRQHYSGEMISDFHQLSEKVDQLAALAQTLRRENADLRLTLATLSTENVELARRIDEASRRVTALLDKIPAADEAKQEAA